MAGLFTVHLRRLRTMPALRELAHGDGSTRYAVDGLVCGVCAMRTHSALADVPGVRAVHVDLERGIAEVEHAPGERPDAATLERALASIVVARGVRRWLADGLRWPVWRRRGVR
jgi:copper chaperone CopZ